MPRDPIEIAEVTHTHIFQLLVQLLVFQFLVFQFLVFQFLVAEFLALLVISLVVVGPVGSLSWVAVDASIRFWSRIRRKNPRPLTTPPLHAPPRHTGCI